ncbi:MAG: hypothetical protein LBC98_04855 [Prevotellaceae bacterium]|jgi:hypothetical protein|nr:hypothetical protein [Prevotellaceae bacterium]
MSVLSNILNKHSIRRIFIAFFSIALIVAIVTASLIMLYNDKKNNPNRLHNELWAWAENGDYNPRLNTGWYETFFFSTSGRFMYIKEFSADHQVSLWSAGNYTFNKSKGEVTLITDNSNLGNGHGDPLLDKAHTIKIVNKDEETITIEGSPITSRNISKDSTTVFRLARRDLLIIPEGSLDREVKEMALLSSTGNVIYETKGDELRTVLDIMNSSSYNREWNSSEIKIPDQDLTIKIKLANGEMIQVGVWISEAKLRILNLWYDVNDELGLKLLAQILKKY